MRSIRPRTYHELMQYRRCLELQLYVPEITDEVFLTIYRHMLESKENSVGVSEGKLTLYEGKEAVDSMAVASRASYTSLMLMATALEIKRPVSRSIGDGGTGGNNNNNNNNNNNG